MSVAAVRMPGGLSARVGCPCGPVSGGAASGRAAVVQTADEMLQTPNAIVSQPGRRCARAGLKLDDDRADTVTGHQD